METPVFVNEDVVYLRPDYSRMLMFGRPANPAAGFNRIYYKPPPWSLFADTFVGAYSIAEVFSNQAVSGGTPGNPAPALTLFFKASYRLPEFEDEYRRFNHASFFNFILPAVAQLVGKSFTVPDFNDFPWLEWLQPPKDPASLLLPL